MPSASRMHVEDVDELVDHDVVAPGRRGPALGDIAPGQHQRPAFHRLAGKLLGVAMHDAGLVDGLAAGHHRIRVDDDADEAVIAVEAEFEGSARKPGLRSRPPSRRSPAGRLAPENSLRARNSVASSRSRPTSSALRSARNGKRSSVDCHSSSGIGRRSSVRVRRQRDQRCHQICHAQGPRRIASPGDRRMNRPSCQRRTSARSGPGLSRSQSLSTCRHVPGRDLLAGRAMRVAMDQRRSLPSIPMRRARPAGSTSTQSPGFCVDL